MIGTSDYSDLLARYLTEERRPYDSNQDSGWAYGGSQDWLSDVLLDDGSRRREKKKQRVAEHYPAPPLPEQAQAPRLDPTPAQERQAPYQRTEGTFNKWLTYLAEQVQRKHIFNSATRSR